MNEKLPKQLLIPFVIILQMSSEDKTIEYSLTHLFTVTNYKIVYKVEYATIGATNKTVPSSATLYL